MRQSKKAGDMFEELIIGNYDLLQQAEYNEILLPDQIQQLSLFDVRENEQGEIVYDKNTSKTPQRRYILILQMKCMNCVGENLICIIVINSPKNN